MINESVSFNVVIVGKITSITATSSIANQTYLVGTSKVVDLPVYTWIPSGVIPVF